LFGLPFLAFGTALFIAGLNGAVKNKSGAPSGLLVPCLLSLSFMAFGFVFLFGRGGIVFDKADRTVTTWWGILFVPLRSKIYQLAEFHAVRLNREKRSSKNATHIVYPIRLAKAKGELTICEEQDELKGRAQAEEIAKFIGFDLVDSTGGLVDVRDAATLGESLRVQTQHSETEVKIDAPPPNMRATFTAQGNQVSFDLPPPRLTGCLLAPLLGMGLVFTIGLFVFFIPLLNGRNTPTHVKWLFGFFFGVLFVLLPLLSILGAVLAKVRRKIPVAADPSVLRLATQQLLLTKTEEIAGADLEELRLETSSGQIELSSALASLRPAKAGEPGGPYVLAALSNKKILRFGEGLPREELEWIRQVLLKALTI